MRIGYGAAYHRKGVSRLQLSVLVLFCILYSISQLAPCPACKSFWCSHVFERHPYVVCAAGCHAPNTNLSCSLMGTAINSAVEKQAGTDAAAECHGHRVFHSTCGAKGCFARHCRDRIIFHPAGQLKQTTEEVPERHPVEIFKIGAPLAHRSIMLQQAAKAEAHSLWAIIARKIRNAADYKLCQLASADAATSREG